MDRLGEDELVELRAEETHALRRALLRDGTASDEVVFDGDELPTTLHLGVRRRGPARADVVAISTWLERRYPDLPALAAHQLRGMATHPVVRGTGLGDELVRAGVERCRAAGSQVVWARARVTAVGFYARHGFEPVGPEYVDLTTGLPHRDIVLRLDRP